VRQDALEGMPLAHRFAAFCVAELDGFRAAAVEHHLPHALGQLGPGGLDIEAVVTRKGLDELEVVRVAAVPAADRATRERELRMRDDALRIEELLRPEA